MITHSEVEKHLNEAKGPIQAIAPDFAHQEVLRVRSLVDTYAEPWTIAPPALPPYDLRAPIGCV